MVVPSTATMAVMKPAESSMCGTNVARSAASAWGWATKPAMM